MSEQIEREVKRELDRLHGQKVELGIDRLLMKAWILIILCLAILSISCWTLFELVRGQ